MHKSLRDYGYAPGSLYYIVTQNPNQNKYLQTCTLNVAKKHFIVAVIGMLNWDSTPARIPELDPNLCSVDR